MQILERVTTKAQADIMEALYESAQVNAEATNGLLVAYAPDLERFPYQSISVRTEHMSVAGAPKNPKKTFEIASLVDSRTKNLEAAYQIADSEENGSPLTIAGKIIRSGQNVVFGTDHAELVDIAFFAAGTSAYLRSIGAEHHSGLIASKAIDYLGVDTKSFGLPEDIIDSYLESIGIQIEQDRTVTVRNFLKIAVDVQWLPIPNTRSFEGLKGLQREAFEAHNTEIKRKISNRMSRRSIKKQPPLALYGAMPGTKNKELDLDTFMTGIMVPGLYEMYPLFTEPEAETVPQIIGRINYGVSEFCAEALSFASAIRLSKDSAPRVQIDPSFHVLSTKQAVTAFALSLTSLVRNLDGNSIYYDIKGNLPTTARASQ